MKSIDVKSLIFGILGTALVMVLMGNSGHLPSDQGHFQVACGIDDTTRCVVIDTKDGKVIRDFNCRAFSCD